MLLRLDIENLIGRVRDFQPINLENASNMLHGAHTMNNEDCWGDFSEQVTENLFPLSGAVGISPFS